jgi:hypothetical protein|tara:strand:+ start:137 stop:343 length:207 start_codon:yes stop_codon:yes gene_type:complete
MNHTVEDLIKRINVMHDKAMELHRIRNAKPDYDRTQCDNILADIRGIAYLIAKDDQNDEIKSEIDTRK